MGGRVSLVPGPFLVPGPWSHVLPPALWGYPTTWGITLPPGYPTPGYPTPFIVTLPPTSRDGTCDQRYPSLPGRDMGPEIPYLSWNHKSGRYASYWDAFLLSLFFVNYQNIEYHRQLNCHNVFLCIALFYTQHYFRLLLNLTWNLSLSRDQKQLHVHIGLVPNAPFSERCVFFKEALTVRSGRG